MTLDDRGEWIFGISRSNSRERLCIRNALYIYIYTHHSAQL